MLSWGWRLITGESSFPPTLTLFDLKSATKQKMDRWFEHYNSSQEILIVGKMTSRFLLV